MGTKIRRPGVRQGYDLWADTYDETPNPLVWLDRRHTPDILDPQRGELILDAGCGTGVHLERMLAAGATPVGIDFSSGMIGLARGRHPSVPMAMVDLNSAFPFRSSTFDVVLSSLVSEHISSLHAFCHEVGRVLRPGGRFVWSVFHPDLARSGVEANFTHGDQEVRLGAELHSEEDYERALGGAGFTLRERTVYTGTPELSSLLARAVKYEGHPLLIIYTARLG